MIASWRHVLKLDPDRPHGEDLLERVGLSRFDAIIVGGTWGVTMENATNLALTLRRQRVRMPLWQEISSIDGIAYGVDGYFIPMVLNAGDIEYMVRAHVRAIRRYRDLIAWTHLLPVGYIVMHGNCAVGERTRADFPRDVHDVLAYADYGVHMCGLEMLYVEYSGVLGDPEVPRRIREEYPHVHVFYGGGIRSVEDMQRFEGAASTLVVGNAIYSDEATTIFA